eukprot:754499-Hanusia_phi.AAC.1
MDDLSASQEVSGDPLFKRISVTSFSSPQVAYGEPRSQAAIPAIIPFKPGGYRTVRRRMPLGKGWSWRDASPPPDAASARQSSAPGRHDGSGLDGRAAFAELGLSIAVS